MGAEKKIESYLHLYIGCKIELAESRFSEVEQDRVFTLGGVIGNKFYINELDNSYECANYHNGGSADKLILRPLSDMTDKEAKSIYELKDDLLEVYQNRGDYNLMLDMNPQSFRYMLSQGFDLFGLIEAGLAIDKTKLPN